MTYQDFINKHKTNLKYRAVKLTQGDQLHKYAIVLNNEVFNWAQGPLITSKPLLRDFLESLHIECAGIHTGYDFESWANDFGFDTDSRKAEGIYHAVLENRRKLMQAMGKTVYSDFVSVEF